MCLLFDKYNTETVNKLSINACPSLVKIMISEVRWRKTSMLYRL